MKNREQWGGRKRKKENQTEEEGQAAVKLKARVLCHPRLGLGSAVQTSEVMD